MEDSRGKATPVGVFAGHRTMSKALPKARPTWVLQPETRARVRQWSSAWTYAALGVAMVLCALSRWLNRSHYLFDLDSILYARALDHFDLRLIQPALPGYYLYIQLGRLARLAFGDANTSLVFLSALFGVLLIPSIYALAEELFDRRTALLSALLVLTGPIFWYQSSFASPRIAEGFFATIIVWLGVRLRRRGEPWVFWLIPITLGIAGGVRQQTLMYLLPFVVWATWRSSWRWRLGAAGLLALVVAIWLVPTLDAAGGLAGYRALSAAQVQEFVVGETGVFYGHGLGDMLRRLIMNVSLVGAYAFFTCLLAPLVLLLHWRPARWVAALRSMPGQALLLAILPAFLFFAFVHIQQIGHVLAIAPFLVLIVARILVGWRKQHWYAPLVAGVVAVNLLFVFFAPARLLGQRVGTPTIAAISARDHFIAAGIAAIQAGRPDETLVVTSPLSYGFIEAYAPGYRYYLIPGLTPGIGSTTGAGRVTVLTNGLTPLSSASILGPGRVEAPAAARRVVLFSYEWDLPSMVVGTAGLMQPDPKVPTVAVVTSATAIDLLFRPGRLELITGNVAMAEAH